MIVDKLTKQEAVKAFEQIYGNEWRRQLAKDLDMRSGNLSKIFNSQKPFTKFQAITFATVIRAKTKCLSSASGVVLSRQLNSKTKPTCKAKTTMLCNTSAQHAKMQRRTLLGTIWRS